MKNGIETTGNGTCFTRICEILEKHNNDPTKLVPILQAVQDECRYLPKEAMTFVATSLGIPPSRVFGVATFYSHFAIEPKGKYVIKLCDGTACHVKNSIPILEAIKEHLGLKEEEKTTRDLLFTVETVSCLGACGLAPVMLVNEKVYGQMTPEKAVEEIKRLQKEEAKNE